MTKKVLDVGQCGMDHPRVKQLVESNFDATVDNAQTAQEAVRLVTSNRYDLIMVNRLLDIDHSSGVGLIETLKQNQATAHVPVMLISNFPDAQDEAVSAGAVPGFGKNALNDNGTVALISPYLGN